MRNRLILPILSLALIVSLSLAGCAPLMQSEGSSDASSGPAGSEYGMRGSGSASTLESMREGRPRSDGPLKNIYFDFDRYELRADARETLKANAEWLKSNPSVRIEIEGHCDERGTSEYNLALGANRAHAARDYLVTLGIAPGRLSTISYGEEVPVCTERTEGCWQSNRNARFAPISGQPVNISNTTSN